LLRYRRITVSADPAKPSKAERQADVALVISYHEARLADLLEQVQDGFGRYDAGELDAFELDELIHHYKRAARLLRTLLDGHAYRRGLRPAVPHIGGVYLFTGVHRYAGRTRNANRRLGQHIQKCSGENSAPFAFNITKADARDAGLDVNGSRKHVAALPDFDPYFEAAKQRVRTMDFR